MAKFSLSAPGLVARALLTVVLVAAASTVAAASFSWRISADAVWAHGCDFSSANDIGYVSVSGEKCSSACGRVPRCTHFVWSTASGSPRCHLKRGEVTTRDAFATTVPDAVCGVMRSSGERAARSGSRGSDSPAPSRGSSFEMALIAAINGERVAAGLSPQQPSAQMIANCKKHSQAMAARGKLFHQDMGALARAFGARSMSENVLMRTDTGMSTSALARTMAKQWMASPGHRKNILTARPNRMGCAAVKVGRSIWATCTHGYFA
ncbi:hypothetical protein MMPV_009225 [Pyropia vietnamensis]